MPSIKECRPVVVNGIRESGVFYRHQEDGRQELACRWSELLAAVTVFVKEHWWGT